MKTTLTAICVFTLLATGFLSLSLLILQPPRADYHLWFVTAAFFLVQGGLTLAVLFDKGPKSLRYATLIGGAGIIWAGAAALYRTLSGPHFEGYALVLGFALIVQGALPLAVMGTQLFKTETPAAE